MIKCNVKKSKSIENDYIPTSQTPLVTAMVFNLMICV